MTRARELELITTTISPSPENPIPLLNITQPPQLDYLYQIPHYSSETKLTSKPIYCVYIWASTDDYLPFFIDIGTTNQATERHKYSNGKLTAHQMYRDLCGPNFICILLAQDLYNLHAQSILYYTYHFYTKLILNDLSQLSNKDIFLTTLEPMIIEYAKKFHISTQLPIPSPSPPECQGVRMGRQAVLKEKIIKSLINQEYQKRKKNKTNQ